MKEKPEDNEDQIYNKLQLSKTQLEDDLKVVTHIYGKVTSSHDYKEFANKTNQLMQKIQSHVKEVNAKIAQWDLHFKQQTAYQEMLKHEQVINGLCEKYL